MMPGISNAEKISEYLRLPRKKVQTIIEFLLQTGLCKMTPRGIQIGASSKHLESMSHWGRVHHSNWRQKAMLNLESDHLEDLHYISPMTLSISDVDVIREKIIQFIAEVNSVVDPSPSESLYCFNID